MTVPTSSPRLALVSEPTRQSVGRLLGLAPRGLRAAYRPDSGEFTQTVRGVSGPAGVRLQQEGRNLRYAAMAALGLALLPEADQREVLSGRTAADVATATATRALDSDDPGAVALAAWAEAEVCGVYADKLFARMAALLAGAPLPTVDASWMVTAATVAAPLGHTDEVLERGAALLLDQQGPGATWPHVLPPTGQPRWRAHVGSFADQVYPLQALARGSVLSGDASWLAAADRAAATLTGHQGEAGQWWWHYDARDGSVVEDFPVYSVHQHAMAPMVLFDLHQAGGADHRAAVERGVDWLGTHPEVVEELVSERFGVVWRKVGRREPPKAARAVHAVTTSLRPGLRVPGLGRVLPATVVDHECRPYELGWLLYAWLSPHGGPGAQATEEGRPQTRGRRDSKGEP